MLFPATRYFLVLTTWGGKTDGKPHSPFAKLSALNRPFEMIFFGEIIARMDLDFDESPQCRLEFFNFPQGVQIKELYENTGLADIG